MPSEGVHACCTFHIVLGGAFVHATGYTRTAVPDGADALSSVVFAQNTRGLGFIPFRIEDSHIVSYHKQNIVNHSTVFCYLYIQITVYIAVPCIQITICLGRQCMY